MSKPAGRSRLLRCHQWIYEMTGGILGHRLIGVPTLLLTSTGRRTGSRRTSALVYAKDHDGTLVVTASNGGADRGPGWFHNVLADDFVQVRIGRRTFTSRAEVIRPDHLDYARLWALMNDTTRGRYDRYQRKTQRPFELVKLHLN